MVILVLSLSLWGIKQSLLLAFYQLALREPVEFFFKKKKLFNQEKMSSECPGQERQQYSQWSIKQITHKQRYNKKQPKLSNFQ